MQYKNLSKLFTTTPDLNKFIDKLRALEQLSRFVATHLEPSLSAQCRVANLRDGVLILSTTSPAWNHKLRFVTLDLLSVLRAQSAWCGLKSIEVRVDYLPTYEYNTITNLNKSLSISAYNAKLIEETANGISCTKLAEALQRLASRSKLIKHEN